MFGVASDFRKTHGEAAFRILAQTAFDGADVDKSGKISTSELKQTLEKLGMKLTDHQTAEIVQEYDADGNHELDQEEFLRLVAELIDGTAKLPMAAKSAAAKVEARGVVLSMDDLFGDDDDEPPPPQAASIVPSSNGSGSGSAEALKQENSQLKLENAKLTKRVQELEAKLAALSARKR